MLLAFFLQNYGSHDSFLKKTAKMEFSCPRGGKTEQYYIMFSVKLSIANNSKRSMT